MEVNNMENAKIPLPELIQTVKTRLQELQYRANTIDGFSRYWKELIVYSDGRQAKYFTVALGEDFLREVCHIDVNAEKQAPDLPRWKVNPPKRAIYLLADFQSSGSVLRKGKRKYTPVPACFMEITERFYAMCRGRYNGEKTIQSKKFTVERFLLHLEQKGVRNIVEMQDTDITSFLSTMTAWSPRTVATSITNLRQFLGFLHQEKYTRNNFAEFVPTVSHGRDGRLPNVWPREAVQKMLDSIDRANPIGKRDYAILLMVTQLGLRDSDIQNLKFANLLWKECRIRLVQTKTKRTLELPLSEEIGCAVIDYLKYGRPKQDHSDYVFVRHCAPYGKCGNYYHIMKARLAKAGIPFERDKTHGLHTLRYTLATRLLEQDIPVQTISEILGHACVSSTKTYLQVDLKGLRKCAIDPDEVFADADK